MNEPTLDAYLGVLREHVTSTGEWVMLRSLGASPLRDREVVGALLELLLTWKARKVRREKVRARVAGRLRCLQDPQATAERVLAVLAEAGVMVRSEHGRKERGYVDIAARPPYVLLELVPVLARCVSAASTVPSAAPRVLVYAGT